MRRIRSAAAAVAFLCLAAQPLAHAQGAAASAASAPARAASGSWASDLPLRRDSDVPGPAALLPWLVVLAVAMGGLWLVRRVRAPGAKGWPFAARSGGAADAPVVVSVRSLGPHASLQVVQWNGKELLLGCTVHAITVLESRPIGAPDGESRS